MTNAKTLYGFGFSFAVTSVFTALLVVAKETSEPLMSWMKGVSGHHWITHGIVTLALFVALGFLLTAVVANEVSTRRTTRLIAAMAAAIVVSGAILFGFFVTHL